MGKTATKPNITDIYRRQADTVYRICLLQTHNAADAEDLTQDTFLRLMNSGKAFESAEHEKAWLIVTAANLCRDAFRRKNRRPEVPLCEENAPAEPQDSRETLARILALPELLKLPLYLYYYEGYSTAEIAVLLKSKDATVRSWLRRGRELLKAEMGGDAL